MASSLVTDSISGETFLETFVETETHLRKNASKKRVWNFFGMPEYWVSGASCLPGKSWHVACAIWVSAKMSKKSSIKLSPSLLARFSVDRYSGYRALRKLEEAGLVVVDRHRGRAPQVTIVLPDRWG